MGKVEVQGPLKRIKLSLGGNVVFTERYPLEECKGLVSALKYHAPFVRGDYYAEIVD